MRTIAIPAGTVFGRLTAIEPTRSPSGHQAMRCRCECGQVKIVRAIDLRSGRTASCGCLQREQARQKHIKHGLSDHEHYARYEPGNVRWNDAAGQARNTRLTKLTVDIAEEIRRRRAAGELQSALAREFGVHRSVVSLIVTGKAWKAH